jgi:hypothetical protein
MADRNRTGIGGVRERWLVTGLWSASVLIVIAGFIIRACGSFLHRADLRVTGVVFIACGLIVAGLGWLSERFVSTKPSNRA